MKRSGFVLKIFHIFIFVCTENVLNNDLNPRYSRKSLLSSTARWNYTMLACLEVRSAFGHTSPSHLVPAGHQLVPGGSAHRLDVVVLQSNPCRGQFVQVRRADLGFMVAYVVPAEVVGQDEDDVRLSSRHEGRETGEEQGKDHGLRQASSSIH